MRIEKFFPADPGAPAGPAGPAAPAGPTGPVTPASPLSPLSPLGPSKHAVSVNAATLTHLGDHWRSRCQRGSLFSSVPSSLAANLMRWVLILLALTISGLAQAEPPIFLACSGDLVDHAHDTSEKRAIIIAVNLDAHTLTVLGYDPVAIT
jgi:hypothetical protein